MLLLQSPQRRALLLVPLVAWASGCVLFDSTIKLAHSVPPIVSPSGPKVALDVRMSNLQLDGLRQGVKKNGFGMETASVFTDRSPAELVRRAMEDELGRTGYECVAPIGVLPRISVELHQVFAEPAYWSNELYAVVEATVTVVLEPSRTFRRRFKGLGKVPVVWAWSDGNYKEAYDEALDDFLKKSVPAIADLLKQPASAPSVWRTLPLRESGDPS